MTELKTLKEIESEFLQTNPPTLIDRTSFDIGLLDMSKRLKQEAIKHLKNLDVKEFGIKEFETDLDKIPIYNTSNVRKWIKHFFSITKEDLKNGR